MALRVILTRAIPPVLSAWLGIAAIEAQAQVRAADATLAGQAVGGSGLPVPRFVSLKSDRVHSRQGPGTDHKVLWVYRRAGLPVEIIREFEGWRQVRDSDGAEGWVLQSLVSGRRTALVMPWELKSGLNPRIELLSDDKAGSSPVAILEAGVIANVKSCDTRWCYVSVGDYRGYVEQKQLWGVYPGETVR
jgi:SH3-like domain-containing protein